MSKKVIWLLTLGLVAALTPALAEPAGNAGETAGAQAETEASAVAAAPQEVSMEVAEPLASLSATVPAMDALPASDFPLFRTALKAPNAGYHLTCVLCNTHADCGSVCPGEIHYDYICARTFGCYGWGPKVCHCI